MSSDWLRGFRAVRRLVHAPDETGLAYDVFDALDPDLHARTLAFMLAHPRGRRIFTERPSLLAVLGERARLEAMPSGSLGHAYLAHLDRHGLDPRKLVELGLEHRAGKPIDPDLAWMAERSALTHDLWHVLSGYGADQLGEAALLLFSLAQAGGRANALLALGANLRVLPSQGPGWLRYAWTAWRRGKRAARLHALPYEELFTTPLAEVRKRFDIMPPEVAHPGGVLRADPIANTLR